MKVRVGSGLVVNTHQNQRRIKRDRRERIGGHAMYFSAVIERDDGDAGGEASQGTPEIGRSDAHILRICNTADGLKGKYSEKLYDLATQFTAFDH